MTQAPCAECEKRYPGCHAKCDEFSEWRESENAKNKAISDARNRESMLNEYAARAKRNMVDRRTEKRRKRR